MEMNIFRMGLFLGLSERSGSRFTVTRLTPKLLLGCRSTASSLSFTQVLFRNRHVCPRSQHPHKAYVLLLLHLTPAHTAYRAGFHVSARRHALSKFTMPAMSPTMTEGGVASWKKKEGESFAAGDVLLEIVRSPAVIRVTLADLVP